MTEVVDRSHMRQQPTVQPVVEPIQVEQSDVDSVIGVKDIVWNGYREMLPHFIEQFRTGALPWRSEPEPDPSVKTAIIAGREVKRQPYIDDFADMMRREDFDNHTRLERYTNPLGPNGGLDWFVATMLAVMIENGRIGLKKNSFGYRNIYINRARTGNPFFRIFGGRLTLLIAIAQWFFIMGGIFYFRDFFGSYEAINNKDAYSMAGAIICLGLCFIYNFIHWRFYKRYAFVMNKTLVDGWKARNLANDFDGRWSVGRMAVHGVNLGLLTTSLIIAFLLLFKNMGWF